MMNYTRRIPHARRLTPKAYERVFTWITDTDTLSDAEKWTALELLDAEVRQAVVAEADRAHLSRFYAKAAQAAARDQEEVGASHTGIAGLYQKGLLILRAL